MEQSIYDDWVYRTRFIGKMCIWVKHCTNGWNACVKDLSQVEGTTTWYKVSAYRGSDVTTEIVDKEKYLDFKEAKKAALLLAATQPKG